MENYPQNLVNQYLKASSKLNKFERIVFKRFAPNVAEFKREFERLASKFEEADIWQYAAMCHLGVGKCEKIGGNAVGETQALLRAARSFRRADQASEALQRSSRCEQYREGALRCYTLALECTADDAVLKASVIREMAPLQPHFEDTSSFASPAHRIHELELAAHECLQRSDFLGALELLDDVVDNICERKTQSLYVDLLRRVEVSRLLLLMALNLAPAHQSPSHIKLLEHYYQLGSLGADIQDDPVLSQAGNDGVFLSLHSQLALAESVFLWREENYRPLKMSLQTFSSMHQSLNKAQLSILNFICEKHNT